MGSKFLERSPTGEFGDIQNQPVQAGIEQMQMHKGTLKGLGKGFYLLNPKYNICRYKKSTTGIGCRKWAGLHTVFE